MLIRCLLGGTLDGVIYKGTILLRLPACNLDFSGVPLGEKISGSQPRVCKSSSSFKDTSKNLGKRQSIHRIAITGLGLRLVGLAHAHQWSPTRLDNLSLHVIMQSLASLKCIEIIIYILNLPSNAKL